MDERIPHEAYRPTFVKSLAMVPIRTLDPVGAIGNYWASRREPSGEKLEAARTVARAAEHRDDATPTACRSKPADVWDVLTNPRPYTHALLRLRAARGE